MRLAWAILGRGLIFNQSWEDPEVDLEALQVTPDDRILVVASGGCNALALALAGPKLVEAIDQSFAQYAFVSLKLAAARALSEGEFREIFRTGKLPSKYRDIVLTALSPDVRDYWKRHPIRLRSNLYHIGRLGQSGTLLRALITVSGARPIAEQLFVVSEIDEQVELWNEIERRVRRVLPKFLVARPAFLCGFGVHPSQLRELQAGVEGTAAVETLLGLIRSSMRVHPTASNYFWQRLILDRYQQSFPHYLSPLQPGQLKEAVYRVEPLHGEIARNLGLRQPGSLDKVSLSDALDWFPAKSMPTVWNSLARAVRQHGTVVIRSNLASLSPPDALFATDPSVNANLTRKDRTGCYARVLKLTRR